MWSSRPYAEPPPFIWVSVTIPTLAGSRGSTTGDPPVFAHSARLADDDLSMGKRWPCDGSAAAQRRESPGSGVGALGLRLGRLDDGRVVGADSLGSLGGLGGLGAGLHD